MEPSRDLWSIIQSPRPRMVPIWYPMRPHWPGNSLMRQLSQEMNQMEQHMTDRFAVTRPMGGQELEVKCDNKVFEVKLGVSNYLPEEIEVKVNDQDRRLVINAKHEEKQDDHGFIARQFTRQIYIPENVEADTIESVLTQDGSLMVRANVKGAEEVKERSINIQREDPKQVKE